MAPTEVVDQDRYSKIEAAGRLNISIKTLTRLMYAGKIGYLRIGGRVWFTDEHLAGMLAKAERVESPTKRAPRQRVSRRRV